MTLAILFFAGVSLLLIGLAVPMILGLVKPNAWYGLRVSYTFDNPEIWYPANRYAGKLLLLYGLILLLATLGLPFLMGIDLAGPVAEDYALAIAALALVGVLLVLALSWRYARRLAKESETGDR